MLELKRNRRNGGDRPLALGQLLDAKLLHDQRLTIRVDLAAEGGAVAIVGLHVPGAGDALTHTQLLQNDTGGMLRSQQCELLVPQKADQLVVHVAAGGVEGRAEK